MKKVTLLLVLLFSAQIHFGQWTTDTDTNTLVADVHSEDMQAVGTSDGKTYVVFWKNVAAPQNYELRVQLLDEDGNQLFGPEGMLVSDAISMSTFTVVWSITIDADDNLYIGVTGTDNTAAIAFKMDTSGNHLWGANGVQVGTGNVVKILPLSNGEAVVAWFPSGQALMQKLDANGDTLWANPVEVVNGSSATVPSELFEMSNGDFTLVFHNVLSGINSYLYAQRYNSDGVAQWANPTQLSNRATTFIRDYSKAQDGDIIYMGYYASAGLRFDSYLQRVNPDGTLPWGINGSDFDTNETDYEMDTEIAFAEGSAYIWAVCTYTNDTQTLRGEYVQKFDKVTGERQFTDNAKQLYPLSNAPDVHAGPLQLINDQPFFLIKRGSDTGVSPVTLHAVFLDENGDFAWQDETKPVATFQANKSRIQFTKPVNGQSVAVFIEQKNTDPQPRIYAQNIVEEQMSITDFESISIFYNNPVGSTLQIESSEVLKNIVIFDISGKKIIEEKINRSGQVQFNTSNWRSGLYLMQIETVNGKKQTFKLIK